MTTSLATVVTVLTVLVGVQARPPSEPLDGVDSPVDQQYQKTQRDQKLSSMMMSRDVRSPSAAVCKPKQDHHAAFGNWASRPNDTHRLSLMAPSLHAHSFRTINEDDLRENNDLLAGATDCPATPVFSPDEPIMGRSLCPWYWKVNYNPQRIPAMLPEAVCRCKRAVTGVNGVVIYECQPLTMHLRVLQLDANCDKYEERSIEMAVACVSVVQASMRLNKVPGIEHVHQPVLMNSEA